jgi:excisionase family DNA binding protein
MSTSPAATVPVPECCPDVFDQLSHCERLLTAKELAGMLAISPKTIYSYVERNMIPYYKIEANIRFRARDVAKWLRDRASSRTEAPEAARVAAAKSVGPRRQSVVS